MDGDTAAQFYQQAYIYQNNYLPVLAYLSDKIVTLSAFTLLGAENPDPGVHLDSFVEAIGSNTYSSQITQEALSGYTNIVDTIAAMTSEATNSLSMITGAINLNNLVPTQGAGLAHTLVGGVDLAATGSGLVLAELISALKTIQNLLLLLNSTSFLSLDSLLSGLLQLGESLMFQVLAQISTIYSHIQAQYMQPVLNIVRDTNQVFRHGMPPNIQAFLNTLTKMLQDLTGKFNQYMVDMYKQAQLINQSSNKSTGLIQNNSQLRNFYKVLGQIISALERVDAGVLQAGEVAGDVQANLSTIFPPSTEIVAPPTPVNNRPPAGHPLLDIIGGQYGVPSQSSPVQAVETASQLVKNIRSFGGS